MQEKSLKVLEFYKIRDMLVERAASSLGKARCPVSDIREIERMQAETEEASTLVARTGVQPISAFDDVQAQVARAKVGGILSPKDLLLCARLMQTARSVRRTLVGEKDEAEETELEAGADFFCISAAAPKPEPPPTSAHASSSATTFAALPPFFFASGAGEDGCCGAACQVCCAVCCWAACQVCCSVC